MHSTPATRPAAPARRRGAVRIIAAALVALAAVAYLLIDFDEETLHGLARTAGAVAAVAVLQFILDARRRREIELVKAELNEIKREQYWRIYSDVYADLAGVDGESSTDSGHLPPRR